MTSLPQFTLIFISLLVIFVYYQGYSAPNEMSTLSRNCQEQIISLGMNVRERNRSHII